MIVTSFCNKKDKIARKRYNPTWSNYNFRYLKSDKLLGLQPDPEKNSHTPKLNHIYVHI